MVVKKQKTDVSGMKQSMRFQIKMGNKHKSQTMADMNSTQMQQITGLLNLMLMYH